MTRIGLAAGLAALAIAGPALANDSQAAIGLGGLELVRNESISMDSEDLYISKSEVRVRYHYTNHSAQDISVPVSFPVPEVPDGIEGHFVDTAMPDYKTLDFHTEVDGVPARLDFVERAEVRGKDVTARIAALGWPLRWFDDATEPVPFIEKLSKAELAGYMREGLIHRSRYDEILPAWNIVAHITRQQVFPAGKTIEVTHRYKPISGGAVGGYLDPHARRDEGFPAMARQFCLDRAFLASFDRAKARHRTRPFGEPVYHEIWLRYLLKPGRNWRGPIHDFRLVIDKGAPDNMVSLCMDGVRKISPTQFEVRKTDYEPDRDLDIDIIEWIAPD